MADIQQHISRIKSWKTAAPVMIHINLLKKLIALWISKCLTAQIKEIQAACNHPNCMMQGRIILILKDKGFMRRHKGVTPSNYQPITWLHNMEALLKHHCNQAEALE